MLRQIRLLVDLTLEYDSTAYDEEGAREAALDALDNMAAEQVVLADDERDNATVTIIAAWEALDEMG